MINCFDAGGAVGGWQNGEGARVPADGHVEEAAAAAAQRHAKREVTEQRLREREVTGEHRSRN
jgi:hypothetical protein